MRIPPLRKRSKERLTPLNCSMLSLAAAVAREEKTGFFPMYERSEDGGFEGSDNNINPDSVISRLSKVETALRGIELAGKAIVAEPAKLDSSKTSEPAE